jgi:hypothetical protein
MFAVELIPFATDLTKVKICIYVLWNATEIFQGMHLLRAYDSRILLQHPLLNGMIDDDFAFQVRMRCKKDVPVVI